MSVSQIPAPSGVEVVILCGGKGTRLGALTQTTPKPLLPVGGRPFLLKLILDLRTEGFERFVLAAHYLAERFEQFLVKYPLLPSVRLVVEPEPLGTGGALRHAAEQVRSATFLALNGDSWVSQPLGPMLADHFQSGRQFTLMAVKAGAVEGTPRDKGIWEVGPDGQIQGFATEKEVKDGWVNAGYYLLDRSAVLSWPAGRFSLEENLGILLKGKRSAVFRSTGRLLDIGTPDIYERADKTLAVLERT